MSEKVLKWPPRWHKLVPYIGVFVVAFGLGAGVIALMDDDSKPAGAGAHEHQAGEATVWTCSMHPQIRQDAPGKCPICGMDLIPLEPGSDADGTDRVVLSERAKTLAELRTSVVKRREEATGGMRLLGRIEPNEATRKTVTAWTGGRIDNLKVSTTGERIRAGQVIATLYSPELYAAQQDLLVAKRQLSRMAQAVPTARAAAEAALEAARDRLRLLGVDGSQLDKMERQSKPSRQVAIHSPFGGTVIERIASEGAYVETGAPLYRVANLSTLWVLLDAYEGDLSQLSVGQQVRIEVDGFPGEVFEGRIKFIEPTVDPVRRTAQVRVQLPNPDGRLRPGMFAQALVEAEAEGENTKPPLVVPESAPLFTGRRSIVYVEVQGTERPTYEARTVRLGPKTGDVYPVVAGLREGERVVTRGAFALDADLQIKGGDSMMSAPDDSQVGPGDAILKVEAAERSKLAPVLEGYLGVQRALADDDLEAARRSAEALRRAARSVRLRGVAEVERTWAELGPRLARHAKQVGAAKTLEEARGAFEALSAAVQRTLINFGNPLDTPLRLAFCPMAMGSEGASWLQAEDEVRNSYFGAKMLSCGEVRETVEPQSHMMSPLVLPVGEAH